MNFLKRLFKKKTVIHLEHEQLGTLLSEHINGALVLWKTQLNIQDSVIQLYIQGNPVGLGNDEQTTLSYFLENAEQLILQSLNEIGLLNNHSNYQSSDFTLSWVSIEDMDLELTFEQKNTCYHFNSLFTNQVFNGISIDT